jgi:hypothetical protein
MLARMMLRQIPNHIYNSAIFGLPLEAVALHLRAQCALPTAGLADFLQVGPTVCFYDQSESFFQRRTHGENSFIFARPFSLIYNNSTSLLSIREPSGRKLILIAMLLLRQSL